jgi:hypothetical protein
MSVENWWNDTDREKQKYWEINLLQYCFVHHKSHTDWPGIGPTGDKSPDPCHGPSQLLN